mmetsp:Transcript_45683/g.109985  ORF Transcript_45683/g.109985 Transcript_45683/m.109985 type:complete len:90 (-) Transcript_45683:325-594(-)
MRGRSRDAGTSAEAFKQHHALRGIKSGKQASSNPKDIRATVVALLLALVSPAGQFHVAPDNPTAKEVAPISLCAAGILPLTQVPPLHCS